MDTENFKLFVCVQFNTPMDDYIASLCKAPVVVDAEVDLDYVQGWHVKYYNLSFGENFKAMNTIARTISIIRKMKAIKGRIYKIAIGRRESSIEKFMTRCREMKGVL